ncbi:MAG: DMT family transporter [Candidatus Dormibacteraceae bacterium]
MTAFLIAVLSALAGAIAFVVQQHVAADSATSSGRSRSTIQLLLRLLRRPLWLAGIGAMVVSQVLSALALGHGDLTVTEPGFATMLLFALPLSAAWRRQRLGVREWLGAFALSAGVAGFVLAAQPGGGSATASELVSWAVTAVAVLVVLIALLVGARHRSAARAATLRGAAAGVLFGVQDALTRRSFLFLTLGLLALLQTWSGYAVVLVGATAIIVAQRAFEDAPLAASLPGIAIGEPLTGIALGAGLYGEQVAVDGVGLAVELVTLGSMVLGLLLVARSPIVQHPPAPNRETG